jgi:hypothetical protein
MELTYGVWNFTDQVVALKIKDLQSAKFGHKFTAKLSCQATLGKRQLLQRGSIEQLVRDFAADVVVANLEHSECRAFAYTAGDAAREQVVGKI